MKTLKTRRLESGALTAAALGIALALWMTSDGALGVREPQRPEVSSHERPSAKPSQRRAIVAPADARSSDQPAEPPAPIVTSDARRTATASTTIEADPQHAPSRGPDLAEAVADWFDFNAAAADEAIDAFCEAAEEFAPPARPEHRSDASAFMYDKIDWEGGYGGSPPPVFGSLHIPRDVTALVSKTGEGWWTDVPQEVALGFDYRWMRELLRFDHWTLRSLETDPPELSRAPNYLQFHTWTKLRIAAAVASGQVPSAFDESRHLADLLLTQENLLAEAVGYQLHQLLDETAIRLAEQGFIVAVPDAGDRGRHAALRKLSIAAPAFFYPGVSQETAERASRCFPPSCGVVHEALVVQRSMANFGSPPSTASFDEQRCARVFAHAETVSPLGPDMAAQMISGDTSLRPFLEP